MRPVPELDRQKSELNPSRSSQQLRFIVRPIWLEIPNSMRYPLERIFFVFQYWCLSIKVNQHGISVFLMPLGMLGTLLSMVDVLPLFSNTGWGQNANLAFLKKHMQASFERRHQPSRATINPEDVLSGDFLAVSKIRGRWGGFETLEKWVTGAFAGHTGICLKDELSNLWVGESGHANEKVCSV